MNTFEPGNSGQFSEELRNKLAGILNQQLADMVDLRLQVRQGYWNLRGRYAQELWVEQRCEPPSAEVKQVANQGGQIRDDE